MPPHLDIPGILEAFEGTARLFPLPSIVLFPDSFAPLNVFEDRYLEMVREAIEDDSLIATALLKPGYVEQYEQTPAIQPVVCLGKIMRPRTHPNGQIELLLYGLTRARIIEEIPSSPFRRARVELLDDVVPAGDEERVARRMRRALDLIPGRQPMVWGLRRMAEQLRGVSGAPGHYADAVAHSSDLSKEALYEVLAETDVLRRFELLIHHLEARASEGAPDAVPVADPKLN